MNKLREPDTFASEIARMVDTLGAPALASAVEKSASLVYKWADGDNDHLPTLRQGVELDKAWVEVHGGAGPIAALMARKVGAKPIEARDVLSEALDVPVACGKAVAAVQAALDAAGPGGTRITQAERFQALSAVSEIIREAEELRAAIKAHDSITGAVPHQGKVA